MVLKTNKMEAFNFNKLLLKTAFSCMACDGDIDKREVELIKRLHKDHRTFGEIDINSELDAMLQAINKDSQQFIKGYFKKLKSIELSEANELKLVEVAIKTIKADDKVEYSEVKFFKVIRATLKIDNETILEKHPDFEDYLEQDIISDSYLSRIQDDFFDRNKLSKLTLISKIDDSVFNELKDNKMNKNRL